MKRQKQMKQTNIIFLTLNSIYLQHSLHKTVLSIMQILIHIYILQEHFKSRS